MEMAELSDRFITRILADKAMSNALPLPIGDVARRHH